MKLSILPMAILAFIPSAATAEAITGPNNPCIGIATAYKVCKTENFPYHYGWEANNGASVQDMGTDGGYCYLATVTPGPHSFRLVFKQSNPAPLPQLQYLTKQINPRKCTAGEGQ